MGRLYTGVCERILNPLCKTRLDERNQWSLYFLPSRAEGRGCAPASQSSAVTECSLDSGLRLVGDAPSRALASQYSQHFPFQQPSGVSQTGQSQQDALPSQCLKPCAGPSPKVPREAALSSSCPIHQHRVCTQPHGLPAENHKPHRHENHPFHSNSLVAGSAFCFPGCSRSPGTQRWHQDLAPARGVRASWQPACAGKV